MERHSEIGERILSKVATYATYSHRATSPRTDRRSGISRRIKDNEIPSISRIIAVADAYNAMTSDRPYREAMGYTVARDRLLQAMGSQFFTDPVVTFLSILAEADDDYRGARGRGFGAVTQPSSPSDGLASAGAA